MINKNKYTKITIEGTSVQIKKTLDEFKKHDIKYIECETPQ